MGILDFGHAFLMRQAIVNASREAARYAVVYRVDASGNHLTPSNFSPTVQSVAQNYLAGILPSVLIMSQPPPERLHHRDVRTAGHGHGHCLQDLVRRRCFHEFFRRLPGKSFALNGCYYHAL